MVPPLTVELGVLLVRRGNERRLRFLYSSPFGTAIAGAHRFAGDATDTDRKLNPGPPAQRFMKPPLSRYIALAQRRTNSAYVASRAIITDNWYIAAPSPPAACRCRSRQPFCPCPPRQPRTSGL